MGFGNKQILTSRVLDADEFLNSVDTDKLAEIDAEVSDLIYQKTGYEIPDDPASAPGMLRGIWADIVLFKIIRWQYKVSEDEIKRRTILKDDAMSLLNNLETGKSQLKSSTVEMVKVSGTKRIITP